MTHSSSFGELKESGVRREDVLYSVFVKDELVEYRILLAKLSKSFTYVEVL